MDISSELIFSKGVAIVLSAHLYLAKDKWYVMSRIAPISFASSVKRINATIVICSSSMPAELCDIRLVIYRNICYDSILKSYSFIFVSYFHRAMGGESPPHYWIGGLNASYSLGPGFKGPNQGK